ncbi:hypothetical protein EVAR_91892_1 [Eumeta japonica]|uniref:Uncharacterized protein n=1 Tax=Eumeta variegata TaxID=151549 RepID=A0A4C1SDW1_EUMVA|nr:hypothetical protein EVAR_91892_1 [Eumeta japonica]
MNFWWKCEVCKSIDYEFWVTAATSSGEGEMSPIIGRKPNARVSARLRLRCVAANLPAPTRHWSRKRPLHQSPAT